MYKKKKLAKGIIGGVFLLCIFCLKVDASTIRLDQAKIRLEILPGEIASGKIKVENPSTEPIDLKVYLQDWRYLPSADGTKEFLPSGTLPLSCASWISFSPQEISLPAFGEKEIYYTVKVPPEAKGAHFAVLFFETVSPAITGDVGMAIKIRLGALFYIEAKGTTLRKAELKDFSLIQDEKRRLFIEGDFINSGNVDLIAEGTYHIIDKKGLVLARGTFNKIYTFPQDKARLKAIWKEPLKKGVYDLVITLDIGKAQQEAGFAGGPILVKELEFEVDEDGNIIRRSELK